MARHLWAIFHDRKWCQEGGRPFFASGKEPTRPTGTQGDLMRTRPPTCPHVVTEPPLWRWVHEKDFGRWQIVPIIAWFAAADDPDLARWVVEPFPMIQRRRTRR